MAPSAWERFKDTVGELLDATGPSGPGAAVAAVPNERALAWSRQLLVPGYTPADFKQLAQIVALLERTGHGVEDLEFALSKGVTVKFDLREGGAWYQSHKNLVTLNRVTVAPRAALAFVHELTHAREFHAGRASSARNCTREQFGEAVVAEEAKTYFREAIVGRQLLHRARGRRDPAWIQFTTSHMMQMWFQLVHAVPYTRRPGEDVLATDAALSPEQLTDLYAFVRPYYRRYVEAYRVPEMIKWDIIHKRRPAMDEQTSTGVLTAAFEKQARERRDDSFPRRPLGLKPVTAAVRQK